MRIRCVYSRKASMDSSKAQGSGTRNLMHISGFARSKYDDCVYIKRRSGIPVAYLLIYVDDILIVGPSKHVIQLVKDGLNKSFEMKDLGDAKRILGMDIIRSRKEMTLWLSQADYVCKVLKRFNMSDVKLQLHQLLTISSFQRIKLQEVFRKLRR